MALEVFEIRSALPIQFQTEISLSIPSQEVNKRNEYNGISLLKGLLMICVILGHSLPGGMFRNVLSYLIYSFHMPMFLALSGFLLNNEIAQRASVVELWKKYTKRLMGFWWITWAVYAFLDYLVMGRFQKFEEFLHFIIFPEYHLWYIPALMLYMTIFLLMKKTEWSNPTILTIAALLTLTCYINFEILHNLIGWAGTIPADIYRYYKPHYFLFFVFGYTLKGYKLKHMWHWFPYIIIIAMILIRIWRFYFPTGDLPVMYTWDFYVLNIFLIILILPFFKTDHHFKVDRRIKAYIFYPIMWIGINSLQIYLWHPILKYIIYPHGYP